MSSIIISNIGPAVNSQFNELRVARKFPIVELTSVYGVSALRDIVTTTGGGTVTNDATEYSVSTTASGIDSAILESALRGRYEPGFAGGAGIGVRIPTAPTGTQIARWGMFDTENGAFFGSTSTNIFVAIRRGGVDTVVNQSAWNVDPLDGTGPIGSADLAYQVLLGGTQDGAFVNYPTATTIIPDSETTLLVNTTSTTITGGEVVFQGVTSGGMSGTRVLATSELLDFTLPIDEVVTLAFVRIAGSATNTVNASFSVTESW